MGYLLDSDACIDLLRGRSDRLRLRLEEVSNRVLVCSIVKAELLYGARLSRDPMGAAGDVGRLLDGLPSLPFDDSAAEAYAAIRASLEPNGIKIGGNDLMIAAIALARDHIVISRNVRHFGKVPGLVVEDWTG